MKGGGRGLIARVKVRGADCRLPSSLLPTLAHPLAHSHTHSLTHSHTHSLTHTDLANDMVHPLSCPFGSRLFGSPNGIALSRNDGSFIANASSS